MEEKHFYAMIMFIYILYKLTLQMLHARGFITLSRSQYFLDLLATVHHILKQMNYIVKHEK